MDDLTSFLLEKKKVAVLVYSCLITLHEEKNFFIGFETFLCFDPFKKHNPYEYYKVVIEIGIFDRNECLGGKWLC